MLKLGLELVALLLSSLSYACCSQVGHDFGKGSCRHWIRWEGCLNCFGTFEKTKSFHICFGNLLKCFQAVLGFWKFKKSIFRFGKFGNCPECVGRVWFNILEKRMVFFRGFPTNQNLKQTIWNPTRKQAVKQIRKTLNFRWMG